MDELVRHCLRELSFDGDLGCNVSRLRDFIEGFYSHRSSGVQGQNVDDAFCAFVWSVIVQRKDVRVGIVPPGGASTEVYVAPQVSAIRKGKAKANGDEAAVDGPAPVMGLVIVDDAAVRPLEDLKMQYGDQVRIAADRETTFEAIIGSHSSSSKLTPMIYTGLQFITREREHGISVLDLGKKSGYDQKTCFYIIKKLVELDLVLKLRQPGISPHIVVHKYFYERSEVWQQVALEEMKAVSAEQTKEDDDASEDEGDGEETKPLVPVHFDPMDARHLSSMTVFRARLTKLLKNCSHNMHTSTNLMAKIGFVNPTRTDRRFFLSRLRELVESGFIERVQVPHANRKAHSDRKVTCIRLVSEDGASAQPQTDATPMDNDDFEDIEASEEDYTGLKANLTLHKQMIDCLTDAGTKGMTLNELSPVLGDFDRRTLDLLLNRLEKNPPPAHLADLGIAQLGETHGRERRYKYYTIKNYLALVEQEQLDNPRYQDADLAAAGGFYPADEDMFYQDEEDLNRRMDSVLKTRRESQAVKTNGKGRRVNPVLPDGTIKKGRPRKSVTVAVEGDGDTNAAPAKKGKKRKRDETEGFGEAGTSASAAVTAGAAEEPPPKKRRGRPPKQRTEDGGLGAGPSHAVALPRKRGRPPKATALAVAGPSSLEQNAPQTSTPSTRRDPRPKLSISTKPIAAKPLSTLSSPLSPLSPLTPLSSLSSLPPSPTPAILESQQELQMNSPELESADPPRSALRRSTRARKARTRDDSPSPVKGKSRRTKPPKSAVLHVPSSIGIASVQDHSIPMQVDEVVTERPPIVPVPVTLNPSEHSMILPVPAGGDQSVQVISTVHAGAPPDTVIDPALLNSASTLVYHSSLIYMTPEPDTPMPGPSSAPSLDVSKKRSHSGTTSTGGSQSKRTKSIDGNKFSIKGNLSQFRRENEILRIVEEAGGILNMSSNQVYEAHAALVETIVKAGGMTSVPSGSKIDKNTLNITLDNLEKKGKVALIKTSVPTLTGNQRNIRIAHLPKMPQETLNAFLSELGRGLQTNRVNPGPSFARPVEEPLAYGGGPTPLPRPSVSMAQTFEVDGKVDVVQLAELFKRDDQKIRDTLLSEKHTVAQLYGYIVGKAARTRALHSHTMELFERGASSSNIVSVEHRIIHLSYYTTDIPISVYCSLAAVLQPIDELGVLLQSPQGKETPTTSIPKTIHDALAPTHSKSRARVLLLLELLRVLGVAVPLAPSSSTTPAFTLSAPSNVESPSTFDILPPAKYTPSTAPLYWRFNDVAPVRLWALNQESPPLWKMVPVGTTEQTAKFWSDLEKACTDLTFAQGLLSSTHSSDEDGSDEIRVAGNSLRRPISWSAVYSLSFYQTEYLRRHIDPATGNTPWQHENEDSRDEWLNRISWVVSASKDVVLQWMEKTRKKHIRELKRAGKDRRTAPTNQDLQEVIARRATEAKEQRERDWEGMLQRVHPGKLVASAEQRVKRVKTRYMSGSGKASEAWERKIANAIKEADILVDKLLSPARVAVPVARPALPIPVNTAVQENVDELIASQGPRVHKDSTTGQKSRKGKEKATDEPQVKVNAPRRPRFIWNRDYDELVRDASVIIKARCRGPTRLEWGAMEQIFPAVPRNSVRQRLGHLKEVPGTETYLTRLEEKWNELWMQYRGTDELPDPNPVSATNFDLRTHVIFLRKHIDKNAIRVGYVEVEKNRKANLPALLEDIARDYDVVEKAPAAPPWDFMWNVISEEAREKQLVHHAFTAEVEDMPSTASYEEERSFVASAAMRMVLGNPNETYDPDAASKLLKGVGEEPVRNATTDLLNRGVLARTLWDPKKSKPGRTLKISDSNLSLLGGQLPREIFQDALALEEAVAQQEEGDKSQEWPTLSTGGDTAFLLELVSENKVRFDVDTSHPQSMRVNIDWNSKKADDDDIETAVYVRYLDPGFAGPHREASVLEASVDCSGSGMSSGMVGDAEMQVDEPSMLEHGKTADGQPAFCRRVSGGLFDCDACLEHARLSLLREMNAGERALAGQLLDALREAGPSGLGKEQLLSNLGSSFGAPALVSVVQRMTQGSTPLAHWVGYAGIVLVSPANIRVWTVVVSDGHEEGGTKTMVFPRRWLDMYGRRLDEMWEAALRTVLVLVLLHPGISQAELRWRVRLVYDRQESREILEALEEEGFISAQGDGVQRTFEGEPADEREEKHTFWFLTNGGRRWYQV